VQARPLIDVLLSTCAGEQMALLLPPTFSLLIYHCPARKSSPARSLGLF